MASRMLGPVVAGLLAATGLLVQAAPVSAAAAACSGATGVTVVVDYNEIGGPTRAGCDPDGEGKPASEVFPAAGFSLEYHPRQPGYVCKVTGLPDDRPCLENDSFWSLWWSDGESGEWVFSNQGAGGLSVPDGGYLAFAWHQGGGNAQPPDVVPTAHDEPSDPPDDDDDDGGNGNGNGNGGGGGDGGGNGGGGDRDDGDQVAVDPTTSVATTTGATTSAAPESASPDRREQRRDRATPSEGPTSSSSLPAAADITDGAPPSDLATDASGDAGSALPTWIGLGIAVLVLGAAGLVTVLRRRTG